MTIQRVKYAAVLVHTIESTAISNHFITPTGEKASMRLISRTILSYQVKFFWSMTNPVPSSDTVMTKRFAPMTILRRVVVVRYTSQDTLPSKIAGIVQYNG